MLSLSCVDSNHVKAVFGELPILEAPHVTVSVFGVNRPMGVNKMSFLYVLGTSSLVPRFVCSHLSQISKPQTAVIKLTTEPKARNVKDFDSFLLC